MANRILKEITTYEASDTFQKFRKTLVNEVKENFDILEEHLQNDTNSSGGSSSGGSGELELIIGTSNGFSIGNSSASQPLHRYNSLSGYLTREEISELFTKYNQLVIELTVYGENLIYIVDMRIAKLKSKSTTQKFEVTAKKYDNTANDFVLKHMRFEVDINVSTTYPDVTFYTCFDNEEEVESCSANIYGSK